MGHLKKARGHKHYDNNNYDQDTNPKKSMYNREALVDHNIRLSTNFLPEKKILRTQ